MAIPIKIEAEILEISEFDGSTLWVIVDTIAKKLIIHIEKLDTKSSNE